MFREITGGATLLRVICLVAVVAGSVLFVAVPAWASIDLGNAGDYGLVDLGNGTTLAINSGPISGGNPGGVLVGNGVTVNLSGGNNGGIPNGLYTDGTANISGNLQNPFSTFTVPTSYTQSALLSAQNASTQAAALPATQTFTTITSTTTISGNGGLNVIDVGSIQNAPLTISGGPSDRFIINVSGSFQTNQPMTLSGVTASQVLFNFTGTSGHVLQTSGGDVLYGTFLATDGGQFQFSELDLTGALINTDGNVQFVSGSQLTYAPFSTIPEPATIVVWSLLGGLAIAAGWWRKRNAA